MYNCRDFRICGSRDERRGRASACTEKSYRQSRRFWIAAGKADRFLQPGGKQRHVEDVAPVARLLLGKKIK